MLSASYTVILDFKHFIFYLLCRFIVEKCDGKLVIENKKKKVMIEELVKSGYDSDPVKVWKVNTDKETALVSHIYLCTSICILFCNAMILKQ